ncbi:hypothetical protein K1T71_005518 [Dendrolimus kikuchii]|uniref:Uncharacterized protein n=1 Tax=Dendrolimus kikuchii TaxID=765133 RepID=A0ACC1D4C1_9NEOP|nr:hypothetical protein K1T71_005518 [Dendrolimus kikuchii]
MRPVSACIFIAILSFSIAEDLTTDGTPEWINNKLNSLEAPTTTSARLDPYIRKALLRALTELEESDNFTTGTDSNDDFTSTEVDDPQTDEIITETLPPTTEESGIQIHSFIVNGQAAFANNTNTTPTLIEKNISILGTTVGNVEQHVSKSNPTLYPFTEIFEARETGVNVQQTRSIQSSSKYDIPTEGKTSTKAVPTRPPTTTTRITTTTTTTTTTPRPTHNDDGENIEEVDDVHVYKAPLVAAFTVQQDAQGLPKKVIPLFQEPQSVNPLPKNNLPRNIIDNQPVIQIPSQSVNINQIPETDYVTQQILLQRHLEEKQKVLEEQLRLLQLQQRQQEDLLRKQQFLIQQKEAQRQQQNFFEQKYQSSNTVSNFQPLKTIPQNPTLDQPNAAFRPQNTQVLIQPSVLLDQQQQVTVANQQLPNREAVDFLHQLRNQQPQQFPLQENHLPQGIATYLQPNQVQVFHPGVNFNQFKPINDPLGLKQNTRVFRQESGVANFGLNQNYNRFNTFTPLQTNNRFYTNQNRQIQYNTDVDLKQLLSQTGFNGRAQEDLNIVSKVLSLNHGINNNVSNRLPFDTRSQIRTFL